MPHNQKLGAASARCDIAPGVIALGRDLASLAPPLRAAAISDAAA